MAENNPFGFDPDDLDRVVREAGEELRQLKDRVLSFLDAPEQPRSPRSAPTPETTGDTGAGVWVVYNCDEDGVVRVDQVYPAELDALRALKGNTDPTRSVQFLPYGMSVSVLDRPNKTASDDETETAEDSGL